MQRLPRSAMLAGALLLAMLVVHAPPAEAGYKEDFVALVNVYYGGGCSAKLEGWTSNTLRIDWTKKTVKLHIIKVLGEIGESKLDLYKAGVRYLKFPNDAGGYNIIDWKTGQTRSVAERAPFYFPSDG